MTRRWGIVVTLLVGSLLSPLSPARVEASPFQTHASILIKSNSDFTAANGITGGTGTPTDPYVIEGWDINASSSSNGITIAGTTAYVAIRNVMVHSGVRGIVLSDAVHITLQSTVVWGNNSTGILVENSSDIGITSNNVTKNGCCISGFPKFYLLGPGIHLHHSSNITVTGNSVTLNYGDGLLLNVTQNVRVTSNTLSGNNYVQGQCVGSPSSCSGILAIYADNTTITGNTIASNLGSGLAIYPSFNVTVTDNSFSLDAISMQLVSDQQFETLSISADNKVDGKPIYYYKDCEGLNLDGIPMGQLIVFHCDGVFLADLAFVNSEAGILLRGVHGLLLTHDTFFSSKEGVDVYGSVDVSLISNNFTNTPGVVLLTVLNITIASNLFDNATINNYYVATLDGLVYHNNFINVSYCCSLANAIGWRWDNGYPSGGNYYSKYIGTDNCSGPSQDICPDPDGIWDRPNPYSPSDHYPLTKPFSMPSDSSAPTWPSNSTLTASNIGTDSVTLSWPAAQDDVETIVYRVDLGTTTVAYVPARYHSYQITGLTPGTVYTFKVAAGDASNYWSASELSSIVTTTGQRPDNGATIYLLELASIIAGIGILGSAIGFLGWKRYAKRRLTQGPARDSPKPNSPIARRIRRLLWQTLVPRSINPRDLIAAKRPGGVQIT